MPPSSPMARPARSNRSSFPPPEKAADYLALAAAPPGFGNLSTQRVDPAQAATAITADLAAILWAAPLPTGATAEAVQRFLTSGGQVLFLAPGGPSDTAFNDLKWSDPTEASRRQVFHSQGLESQRRPAARRHRRHPRRRQPPQGDPPPDSPRRRHSVSPLGGRRTRHHPPHLRSRHRLVSRLHPRLHLVEPRRRRCPAARRPAHHRRRHRTLRCLLSRQRRVPPPPRILPGETRSRFDDHGTPDPANAEYEAGVFRLGERLLAVNRPPRKTPRKSSPAKRSTRSSTAPITPCSTKPAKPTTRLSPVTSGAPSSSPSCSSSSPKPCSACPKEKPSISNPKSQTRNRRLPDTIHRHSSFRI